MNNVNGGEDTHTPSCRVQPSAKCAETFKECEMLYGEVRKMRFNSDPHVARNMNNTPLKALPMQRRDEID